MIFCSGRSARPATSQPSSTDSAVIAASASAYCTRRRESASSATSCWIGAAQLIGGAVADRHVVGGEVVAYEDVADGQQRRAGEQEDARVEQRQAQADRRAWHQTR